MAVIIIEGCDASGKTTLIKQLSKALPGYFVQKGSSFEHSQCTQDELLYKFREMLGLTGKKDIHEDIIFDRFIYSNEVYASLYDDYAILSDKQRRTLENIIDHEAIVVYLYASPETLKERLNTRGDDYVKAERIPAILQKYNESLIKINKDVPLLSFDTEANSTETIVAEIVKHAKLIDKEFDGE